MTSIDILSKENIVNWKNIELLLGDNINLMKNCEQDSIFHQEGNVWNHTQLVIEKLLSNKEEFQCIDYPYKFVVFMAALLHDIGKPFCSKDEDNKITSKKHASLGSHIARELLWKSNLEISFKDREEICNLIMLHILPLYFLDKRDPYYSVLASSFVLDNWKLYLLADSDVNGRICNEKDKKDSLEKLELFKYFCNENDVFYKPKEFQSDKARFRYFFEFKGHPSIDYFEPENGIAIIMSGIQGSGKSTIAMKKYNEFPIVGLDITRDELDVSFGEDEGNVARQTKEECRKLMREKKSFIFDATNTIKSNRANWIRLFRAYGYRIVIEYVEKSIEITLKNNKNREKFVPEGIILEKFKKIEIPTKLECHNILYNC